MNRIKTVFQKLWSYETFHIFMYSIALNAVIECLNNRGLTGLLKIFTSPVIFLMNTLIIMTTLSIGLFFIEKNICICAYGCIVDYISIY